MFVTPCFHPNVDEQGFICLDILKDKWSALYDVRSILLSIQSLLGGMCSLSAAIANHASVYLLEGTKYCQINTDVFYTNLCYTVKYTYSYLMNTTFRWEVFDVWKCCNIFSFSISPEPNNESPLNAAAAELWDNQEG